MKEFDTDGNGTISFEEFLEMIIQRPWKHLLPKETQALLQDAGKVYGSVSPPRKGSPKRNLRPPASPSEAIADATKASPYDALGNQGENSLHAAAHAKYAATRHQHQLDNAAAVAASSFRTAAKSLFHSADSDKNGVVDEAELISVLTQLHSSHG